MFRKNLITNTPSFGRELGKILVYTTVSTAASVAGVFVGFAAIGKGLEYMESRTAKKNNQ